MKIHNLIGDNFIPLFLKSNKRPVVHDNDQDTWKGCNCIKKQQPRLLLGK